MYGPLSTFGDVRKYLGSKINAYQKLKSSFDDEVAKDAQGNTFHHQAYWLSWNGVNLTTDGVQANEASAMLPKLTSYADDEVLTEHFKRGVFNHVLRLNTRINDRSSSMASNIAEDASKAFWIDLSRTIEGK